MYDLSAYGLWHVSTEGDVEGRSTTDLGVHEGWLDEVAFSLADRAAYSLTFTFVESVIPKEPAATVSVNFHHTMKIPDHPTSVLSILLRDRPVKVTESNYYRTARLSRNVKDLIEDRRRKLAQNAISKLTPEEVQALKDSFK